MATDFSALLCQYPETISKDQLYRICHISKRKATWLLEHGYIPCEDSGGKTWRFKIKTVDVIKYLQTMEAEPHKVTPPVGLFNSNCPSKRNVNPLAQISVPEFEKYLSAKWRAASDALQMDEIVVLTGYTRATVGQWIYKKRLRSVSCPGGIIIAKKWLIAFVARYTKKHPSNLSVLHKTLAEDFLVQVEHHFEQANMKLG